MREIRAEATAALTFLTFLQQIEPFLNTNDITVNVYTRSRGMINKVYEKYLNRPTFVKSDHIDVFYQIRDILQKLHVKISFIYTKAAPKEVVGTIADKLKYNKDEDLLDSISILSHIPHDPNEIGLEDLTVSSTSTTHTGGETSIDDTNVQSSSHERIMRQVLDNASPYFQTKDCLIPSQNCIILPAQKICVTYNRHPIVANIGSFLQETERKLVREEYFDQRMKISPLALSYIDKYALGRVMQKTKSHQNIYSKILHIELNTMKVNQKWKLGDPTCPFCNIEKEDWTHIITCNDKVRKIMRKKCIADFEILLDEHKTYPPL